MGQGVWDHGRVPPDGPIQVLRAVAEPMRWRIVELLANEELCVRHLCEELAAHQPLVSHHLRVLTEAGLLTSERRGSCAYYRAVPTELSRLAGHLGDLAGHASAGLSRRPC